MDKPASYPCNLTTAARWPTTGFDLRKWERDHPRRCFGNEISFRVGLVHRLKLPTSSDRRRFCDVNVTNYFSENVLQVYVCFMQRGNAILCRVQNAMNIQVANCCSCQGLLICLSSVVRYWYFIKINQQRCMNRPIQLKIQWHLHTKQKKRKKEKNATITN